MRLQRKGLICLECKDNMHKHREANSKKDDFFFFSPSILIFWATVQKLQCSPMVRPHTAWFLTKNPLCRTTIPSVFISHRITLSVLSFYSKQQKNNYGHIFLLSKCKLSIQGKLYNCFLIMVFLGVLTSEC